MREFVQWLSQGSLRPRSERLAELNARLSDLIDFLDPDLTRFPLRLKERSRYRQQP